MIYLDSNTFVIDLRYTRDRVYRTNRRFLDSMARSGRGVTGLINVLEVCGILSFNLSPLLLHDLYVYLGQRYRILVVPAATEEAAVPRFRAEDLLQKMSLRMALKDAEIALAAEQLAPKVETFITWNVKHFVDRLPFPVMTPADWLRRQ